MASETLTEQLVRTEMKFVVGENDFGTVLAQSNTENFSDIELALQNAGGKPKECEMYYMTEYVKSLPFSSNL